MWTSFLYLYIVGGIFFWGIILFSLKKKALRMDRKADRYLLASFVLCYSAYFLFQGIWNYLAINSGQ